MPIADYNLWPTWQALYDVAACPEYPHVRLSYHRAALYHTLFADRAAHIPPLLGWTPDTHIVILGCGFGWFVEHLHARGYPHVIGADTSTFVHAQKHLTEEADIDAALHAAGHPPHEGIGAAIKARLFDGGPRARVPIYNEDARTLVSQVRLRQGLGGQIDVVYTEDVLSTLTDVEVRIALPSWRRLAPVTHLLTCLSERSEPGAQNWKILTEWQTLVAPDRCIQAGTYQVL